MGTILCSDEVSGSLNVKEVMENEMVAFPLSLLLVFSGEPEVGPERSDK